MFKKIKYVKLSKKENESRARYAQTAKMTASM